MSIQNEIDRIKANVADSFTAIKDCGTEVTVEKKSDTLPAAIGSIFENMNEILNQIIG